MTQTITHAIVRQVGENFFDGETSAELGRPDFAATLDQHSAYVQALRAAGADVTVLPADPKYPDGTFVEDTAVILDSCVVITNPGAASRQGEERAIEAVLADHFSVRRIEGPGTLEGGDVMRIGKRLFVGLSARTNEQGIAQLADIAAEDGYETISVPVRDVLHLKTGITALDDSTLIGAGELVTCEQFADFQIITLTDADSYSANTLRVNDTLLTPRDFDGAAAQIRALGHSPTELAMSEFRKMDGGLTCLSLLW
jgi:dimethylargininase